MNTAGSYLYEPAGSVHTLHSPASNTEETDVWFTIYGANLNLDADGNVETVIDAHSILFFYKALCEDQHGIADPPVILLARVRARVRPPTRGVGWGGGKGGRVGLLTRAGLGWGFPARAIGSPARHGTTLIVIAGR